MSFSVRGEDGRFHDTADNCLAQHYVRQGPEVSYLACGQDFMAGTICSLPAGHLGPDEAWCPVCHGDWELGTCTCETEEDDG